MLAYCDRKRRPKVIESLVTALVSVDLLEMYDQVMNDQRSHLCQSVCILVLNGRTCVMYFEWSEPCWETVNTHFFFWATEKKSGIKQVKSASDRYYPIRACKCWCGQCARTTKIQTSLKKNVQWAVWGKRDENSPEPKTVPWIIKGRVVLMMKEVIDRKLDGSYWWYGQLRQNCIGLRAYS